MPLPRALRTEIHLLDEKDGLQSPTDAAGTLIGPDGSSIPVSHDLYEALLHVVEAAHAGLSVLIRPLERTQTLFAAENLVDFDRATLEEMIERGELAATQTGPFHIVDLADLVQLQHAFLQRREAAMKVIYNNDEE